MDFGMGMLLEKRRCEGFGNVVDWRGRVESNIPDFAGKSSTLVQCCIFRLPPTIWKTLQFLHWKPSRIRSSGHQYHTNFHELQQLHSRLKTANVAPSLSTSTHPERRTHKKAGKRRNYTWTGFPHSLPCSSQPGKTLTMFFKTHPVASGIVREERLRLLVSSLLPLTLTKASTQKRPRWPLATPQRCHTFATFAGIQALSSQATKSTFAYTVLRGTCAETALESPRQERDVRNRCRPRCLLVHRL